MNTQEISKGLESGRLHPFPLLQHLSNEGDQDGARFVAETGSEYVHGKERLHFQGLVRELVPEIAARERAEMAGRSQSKQQERSEALGESLTAMNKAERERREKGSLPTGGGWSLPPAV